MTESRAPVMPSRMLLSMPPRSAVLALTALLLAGCVRQLIPTELATAGRVYDERQDSSGTSLVPAPGVLVLAERINVCDQGRFAPDGSTTGIDSYLVRTDARGGYQIPPLRFTGVCSRVVLLARAFVPGHHALSGRVALLVPRYASTGIYSSVLETDAILQPRQPGAARVRELYREPQSATSSTRVTEAMAHEIYREMAPEIERLLTDHAGQQPFEERILREGLRGASSMRERSR